MSRTLVRIRLFFGAYAPLFAMLALRFDPAALRITCAVAAFLGGLSVWRLVSTVPKSVEPDRFTVTQIRDTGPEVAGFLASYLLPFVTIGEPDGADLVAYAAFLAVTGLIYIRSEMTQINPTLYLFGRRVVHLQGNVFEGFAVIRSATLRPGDKIRKVNISSEVIVQVRDES